MLYRLFTPNTWYVFQRDGGGCGWTWSNLELVPLYISLYIYCIYTAGSRILVHAQKWDKVSVFEVPEDATEAERLERIPRIKDLFATPTDPILCSDT